MISATRAYIGFAQDTAPWSGDISIWFVNTGGTANPGYYRCGPLGEGGFNANSVLYAPPILAEEARVMGIRMKAPWHGPGRFKMT